MKGTEIVVTIKTWLPDHHKAKLFNAIKAVAIIGIDEDYVEVTTRTVEV